MIASEPRSTCQAQPPPSGRATARAVAAPARVSPKIPETTRPSTSDASEVGRSAAAKSSARAAWAGVNAAAGSTGVRPPAGVGSRSHGVTTAMTTASATPSRTATARARRRPSGRPGAGTAAVLTCAGSLARLGCARGELRERACASADEAAGADVPLHVDAGDQDRAAGGGGVHHLAVADVHADVAHRAVEEDQVTGLQVAA